MTAFSPGDIARRVRSLIEQHDNGDEVAAARRLGVSRDTLAELLASSFAHPNLDTLGAITDAYEVDAIWLLTGEHDLLTSQLSAEARLGIAEILSALSARALSRYAAPDGEG